MSEPFKDTVRIHRKPKEGDDESQRNVWTDPIDTIELELVSTGKLTQLLDSDDAEARKKIEDAATQDEIPDGVLARDVAADSYEFVSVDEKEELALVSTQMLKRILTVDGEEDEVSDLPVDSAGFDPYDKD
jgi:hypothetical protein